MSSENLNFLPTSAKEVAALGWDWIDVILFTGDAYIDHPSFGASVIGRTLQAAGYRVAIVPQPNWQDDLRDFRKLGEPRLFFGITAGAMDSIVSRYTPTLRLRSDDAYTPDNRAGARPDYPTVVYTKILKSLFPHSLVVLGGIEASLRRVTHYDYLQNKIRPSFLVESGADILSYGMGEKCVVELANAIKNNTDWREIPQIAYFAKKPNTDNAIVMHSYEDCVAESKKFGENFVVVETQSNRLNPSKIIEPYIDGAVVVNPPYPTFSTKQCDETYALPYMRSPAPRYKGKPIKAWDMIKHSINIHRGCYGGCSFCAISMHQGKFIASRSRQSIVDEAIKITQMEDFGGTISDIGGPSANMWGTGGKNLAACAACSRPSCLFEKKCINLSTDHSQLLDLYQEVSSLPRIKHLFVGSGIRYDMFEDNRYLERVVTNHTGGRLKVAPEHTQSSVLALMRKPDWSGFEKLKRDFEDICRAKNLPYQIIPYFISAHPGCTNEDMLSLQRKTQGVKTEQVQDFTPTPLTLSSVMYYTGINPYTGQKVFVARGKEAKDRQKSYFFDNGRKNYGGAQKNTGAPRQKRYIKRG